MSRRPPWAAAWLALALAPLSSAAAERPNLVLLLSDDLAWNDPAFAGHTLHQTPSMDRLAAQGARFTQAYSSGPNCAPTRAALMSGQVGPRTGVYTVGSSERGRAQHRRLIPAPNRTDLPPEVTTLAEALHDAGYATASIGKWHLGPDPREHGFEVNVAGDARGSPRGYESPYRNPALPDGPAGEHLTDRLAAEAVAFLERCAAEDAGRPFFLYLPFFSVHTPIQGRRDLVERARKRIVEREVAADPAYVALVEGQDEALGRVLDALERLELAEDTLVVFTSDNGGHGVHADPRPLRGSKGMLYEGGLRVPLVVRWPGRVAPGAVLDAPVVTHDLYPTLLAAAGVALPDQPVDGVDLLPHLTGGAPPAREALFWHFPAYLEGYRAGERWRTTPASAVRVGRHKLLEFFEDGRRELYDLAADPSETHDLAGERPELAAELAARLAAWRAAVGAFVPSERNPEYRED